MTAALTNGAAPLEGAAAATPMPITIGEQEITLERVSARKASRALALLRALTRAMPELQSELAAFRRTYEAENIVELDRVQARMRYPGRVLVDDDGQPVLEPAELDGEPNPRAGQPVMIPSPVDRMTEADWQEAGGVLKLPATPDPTEIAVALFDKALEAAEDHVYRLLALFTMSNQDVTQHWRAGDLDQALQTQADHLLDEAYGDEIMTLAVACGELVDTQFVRKAKALGGRLGNLARLVGFEPPATPATPSSSPTTTPAQQEDQPTPAPSTDGPSSSTPTSSTASPAPTPDGPPTPSSTSPGSSPSPSPSEPPETASSTPSTPRSPTPAATPA